MKYFVTMLFLIGVVYIVGLSTNPIEAKPPLDSQFIYDTSEIILVGKVTSVNSTFSPTHNLYQIEVEKFLKNQLDTNVVSAAGQNTVFAHLGNQVFKTGDRALFFLNNDTVGYDRYTRIFGISYESRLVEPQWDKCGIFEKTIPGDHWVFGGIGPMPKASQKNNTDSDNFEAGKEVLISYDLFNHTPDQKNINVGIQIKNLDDPGSLYVYTETSPHLLEPCTVYETLSWNFTPNKPGRYSIDFYDLAGSRTTIGFTAKNHESSNSQYVSSPLKQFESAIPMDEIKCKEGLVLITKSGDGSPACVTIFTKIELIVRGWTDDDRVLLGCIGERVSKCYPDDPFEYRKALYDYYLGDEKDLLPSDSFDFTSLHTINACTKKPWICYGEFDNGTRLRVSCDYPIHGCGPQSFDMESYKIANDATQWKRYITVSASRNDDPEFADVLPAYKVEGHPADSLLNELLVGADGCKNETELCEMPRGVSLDRTYPFLPSGRFVPDDDKYTITLDPTQAEDLLSLLSWQLYDDSFYTIVQRDNNQYLLVLSSFDHTKTPDVKMEIVGSFPNPIQISKGDVLNYTIRVNAWATYGVPAQIDFSATQSAKDSGIDVWVEPASLTVPERSNVTTTLFIQSQKDAKDGIYSVRVVGDANGKSAGLHCGNTICPTVRVGDSDWSIRTLGTSSGMGIGAANSPNDTWAEISLNKNEFFEGDVAEISAFVVNNSTKPIVVDDPRELLIKVIRADSKGYYDHFYGINAVYESDEPITLQPKSKTLLARTFYWNQTTFHNFEDEQRLEPSRRMITMDFAAGNYGWSAHTWVEIK